MSVLPTRLSATLAVGALATSALLLASAAPAGALPLDADNGPMASNPGDAQVAAVLGATQTPQTPEPSESPGTVAVAQALKKPKITYPKAGRNTFKVATGRSKVAGKKGPLLTYRVAVEKDIAGITANQFAARVVETLGDRRSWSGTGSVRLQRVPNSARYDFTIYLATPQTRDTLCQDATRENPDRYTSCRNGDRVVLNVARWVNGVPDYGASLERYRTYLINHETGHRLGYRHQKCPKKGKKAPVMQQQTLGLHGCTANAWPRVKGNLYQGPAGAYADPIPEA